MSSARWIVLALAIALVGTGLGQLQGARSVVEITRTETGSTPVSVYRQPGMGAAPAVVIAHGFAGSRQLMQSYALTLAQAGYIAVSFDFLGHGRHPDPMTGDLETGTGATQILMNQTAEVINFALNLDDVDGRVALLGHSMATDIIVRQAARDRRVNSVVAISMFSQAVTDVTPRSLLMITGEWENTLREEALRVLRLVDPTVTEGQIVQTPEVIRSAVVAPGVEHVGVLYSQTGVKSARDWLNLQFDRSFVGPVATTGLGIVLTMIGLVTLMWPVAGMLRPGSPPLGIDRTEFWIAALVPAMATPILLSTFELRFLPVLVADYLGLHLAVYGALTLLILRGFGYRLGQTNGAVLLWIIGFGVIIFGVFLDRYVTSFLPAGPRPLIIAALAIGAIPYALGEARLLEAGHSGWGRALIARSAFLASLGLAIALDYEGLFFLLIILPVIVVFFVVFGLIGGWFGRRTGSVMAVGIGTGFVLAWALGVTFPLFIDS